MNKQWVESNKSEYRKELDERYNKLVKLLNATDVLSDDEKKYAIDLLTDDSLHDETSWSCRVLLEVMTNSPCDDTNASYLLEHKFLNSLNPASKRYFEAVRDANQNFDHLLDSEPIVFDGDIIITDPCYIIRSGHHGSKPITHNDWYSCNYGSNFEVFGITHYMTRDTLYGDWNCTVFDRDTDKQLGEFCADSGQVSVFLLDEVLKYNPNFNYHIEKPWTTTLIKGFKGEVQFVVEEVKGVYSTDCEDFTQHHAGDTWTEYHVKVMGQGINKTTNESINFYSTQTGL